jgi:hypothetical protein
MGSIRSGHGADDALRRQTQPVAIERHGGVEIVDAEGQHADSGFH